jgi:cell division protein FtsL
MHQNIVKAVKILMTASLASFLSGCATTNLANMTDQQIAEHNKLEVQCHRKIDDAWKALEFEESQGAKGTVSYTKALYFITAAKTQRQAERYQSCIDKAIKALYYIAESKKGR